jgi:hypothetical protein
VRGQLASREQSAQSMKTADTAMVAISVTPAAQTAQASPDAGAALREHT